MSVRKGRPWLILLGLALGAALGIGVAWSRHGNKPAAEKQAAGGGPPEAVTVTVARVTTRPVERAVEVVGTLEGYEEVPLGAKVEGRIARIHKEVGDEVAPGETLAEIDDTDYRLALLEAQRGLDLELARLGVKELPADGKIDYSRVPAVMRSKNQEENARLVMERARRLGGGRVIATEELEKAQMEARVSGAAREQAELEARAILASARLRQAQVETASQRLADASIRVPAPSASRLPPGCKDLRSVRYQVASRKVSEGEMVRAFPAVTLFRLVIDRPLKLLATVPERFLADLRVGQPVTLRVEAYPTEQFQGTLTRLHPTVDRGSRTFMVEVTVPNESRRLRPGSFVKARIRTHQSDSALTVPEEAIVRFAGVVKVFVVKEGIARGVAVRAGEVVQVKQGDRVQRWVEVAGKLPVGADVVTSGMSMLADETPVRLR